MVNYENKNEDDEITVDQKFKNIKDIVKQKHENMQSSGINNIKRAVIGKLVENISSKVEQKDKKTTSQNRKRVSVKENVKSGRFSKAVSDDIKGKNNN